VIRALALFLLMPLPAGALEVLRLPWIFSDRPELTADFNFSPAPGGKTNVELALGGRFSRFGLPNGAARAPILEIRCDFVNPGELVENVAALKTQLDLGEILSTYGASFSESAFSSSSPFVFKTQFKVALKPSDYNIVVSIRDKELSISSSRTLHVIVPAISPSDGIGDLEFCQGVGESLDAQGRPTRLLDPNPWRQVGGAFKWGIIVAYDTFGAARRPHLWRRHSIWRLRGDNDEPLWQDAGPAPPKKPGQLYIVQVAPELLKGLSPGVYVFKVEFWDKGQATDPLVGSKTFEVLP
jgi:hypothetical protein